MRSRSQRGSALLLAMIVVLVITIIAVAMIRYSSRELAGATAARQNSALVACAEAGRQLLTSQFRSLGVAPTQLQALNVTLDGAGGDTRVLGGHVDTNVQVDQVTVLPSASFGVQQNSVRDLTNIIAGAGQLGGTPYRVVVHCQDHGTAGLPASGRQLEVEFGIRFGL
jgi:Tfp pilus assembly protein PilX